MNRESIPLIIALLIPIIIVILIVLYMYGHDITKFLRELNILYYIVIIPFILGFLVIIIKWLRPNQ